MKPQPINIVDGATPGPDGRPLSRFAQFARGIKENDLDLGPEIAKVGTHLVLMQAGKRLVVKDGRSGATVAVRQVRASRR